MCRARIACAAEAVACLALPAGAAADRNLFVGTSGNPLRWEPKAAVDVANELGVHVFRIVDLWKLRIRMREDATYAARLERVDSRVLRSPPQAAPRSFRRFRRRF